MAPNPVGWFEIYVQDMERAKGFYEKTFAIGMEKLESPGGPEMWAFPMSMSEYGTAGALAKMDGVSPGGNSVLVYFKCEDCAQEAKRAAAAGGRVVKDKFSIGQYGFIALVFDSEGNMIGLHSRQ